MITADDKLAYTVTASIQNALAAALAGKVPLINLRTTAGSSLPHDLRSGYLVPRSISLDFTPLFDVLQLHNYGQAGLNPEAVVAAIETRLRRILHPDGKCRLARGIRRTHEHEPPPFAVFPGHENGTAFSIADPGIGEKEILAL